MQTTHDARLDFDIYAVITSSFCTRSPIDTLHGLLAAGVRFVQMREKNLPTKDMLALARTFRSMTREFGAALIINDRIDIALAVNADGVHLGQDDMPLADAKRIAPALLFGVSTHSLDEALEAQTAGADYINIGPIFATQTKEVAYAPVGTDGLRAIAPHIHIPYTVMGGIKEHNVQSVYDAGARRFAFVTELTQAADPAAKVNAIRAQIAATR